MIPQYLKVANLILLILFPVSWFAPLMKAGLLPFFKLDEISIISGLNEMWESDVLLALLVTFFALIAPMVKVLGTAAVHFDVLTDKSKPVLEIMGKFAMADIFLIALYIVIAKGVGVGRLETAWGLYLFTACVLASYAVTIMTGRLRR